MTGGTNASGGSSYEEKTFYGEVYIERAETREGAIGIPDGYAAAKYVVLEKDNIKVTYVQYDRASNTVTFGGEGNGYVGSNLMIQVTAVKTM